MPKKAIHMKEKDCQSHTILVIGDVFGKSGRQAIQLYVRRLQKAFGVDCVIANGENAAGGIGITPDVAEEIFQGGVDIITSGNHVWKHKAIFPYLDDQPRLLRPLNYPSAAPGRGFAIFETQRGTRIGVLNLQGRVFMASLDCPFQAADNLLATVRLKHHVDALIVDMHGEASSEKIAMAYHLDGRVSAVVGTHTHVPTADYRILPKGTGFQTDLGMTGSYNSIIGMKVESVLPRFLNQLPSRFEPATAEGMLCGVLLTINGESGQCQKIVPVRQGIGLSATKELLK